MSAIKYRASIDGLRTVAVVAVLVFHLDKRLLPGGFVGVDVFFVISGYLITSIIDSDCRSGGFSLSRFYQRRVARIFPVFFLVTLFTLVGARLLYTSQDYASSGALAVASVLSVTNMKLMFQGSYFEVSPDAQPFLHFWSLSVEEQFYLLWPAMLVLAHKANLTRRTLLAGLLTLTAVSFIACVVMTASKPSWAFYLLPTRAWELLMGATLAIIASRHGVQVCRMDRAMSLAGLLLIVLALLFVRESGQFPGYIAAVPVLGTVLVIGRTHCKDQFTERLLSRPPFVSVGKISYSLYLWHWPVYCFVDYSMCGHPFLIRLAVKVLGTLVLAITSYNLVENPLRRYFNVPSRKRFAFVTLGLAVGVFVGAGVSVRNANYINCTLDDVSAGGVEFPAAQGAPGVVLMGDSIGSMYGTVMPKISAAAGVNINVISVASGDPFPPSTLFEDSLRFLEQKKPRVTIFSALWIRKISPQKGGRGRLAEVVGELLKHSEYVILVTQPPVLPQEALREGIRDGGAPPFLEHVDFVEERAQANEAVMSLEGGRVHVLNIEPLFVMGDGQLRIRSADSRQLFQDRSHLSARGAALVGDLLLLKVKELCQD